MRPWKVPSPPMRPSSAGPLLPGGPVRPGGPPRPGGGPASGVSSAPRGCWPAGCPEVRSSSAWAPVPSPCPPSPGTPVPGRGPRPASERLRGSGADGSPAGKGNWPPGLSGCGVAPRPGGGGSGGSEALHGAPPDPGPCPCQSGPYPNQGSPVPSRCRSRRRPWPARSLSHCWVRAHCSSHDSTRFMCAQYLSTLSSLMSLSSSSSSSRCRRARWARSGSRRTACRRGPCRRRFLQISRSVSPRSASCTHSQWVAYLHPPSARSIWTIRRRKASWRSMYPSACAWTSWSSASWCSSTWLRSSAARRSSKGSRFPRKGHFWPCATASRGSGDGGLGAGPDGPEGRSRSESPVAPWCSCPWLRSSAA